MKKKVFILGLAFSLLMTGCGSSAEIGNGAGAAAPATSEETESEAEMYSFDKDSADASWGVDSITEPNTAAVVTVKKTGSADYLVQLKQNDVKLEKNHKYY